MCIAEQLRLKYRVIASKLEFLLDDYPRYAQGRSGKWFELTAKLNGKDVGFVRYKKRSGGLVSFLIHLIVVQFLDIV